jgi:two-component system nitrate/nitrite sensor histidine kinase NarX
MLFSSSVISEALPRLMERDQTTEKLMAHLERLQRLNRGALAEMRNLLLELRDITEHVELTELLHQLSQATMGRTEANVTFRLDKKHGLPQEVQVAFYRIAQEALQNTVRHAFASEIDLSLQVESDAVVMTIQDNGKGFNPEDVPASRMGIGIMQERAAVVEAVLKIDSAPGQGTRLTLRWTGKEMEINLAG